MLVNQPENERQHDRESLKSRRWITSASFQECFVTVGWPIERHMIREIALEAEMVRRGMLFDVIDWSEDQATLLVADDLGGSRTPKAPIGNGGGASPAMAGIIRL
jgi:hypothetical protein